MSDDETIIRCVLAGQRDQFRLLVERYEAAVWGVTRALCPHEADRDDLAQEAFVAAFLKLATFDASRGTFRTWLLTIARNTCRNARRRPVCSTTNDLELIEPTTPAHLAAEAECFRRLDAALAALPEDQRLMFVLIEVQGASHAEAAAIADVPMGTVKSRLFRAREWLREALAERESTSVRTVGRE
jgi:RNA polymerase sigma-70 factor (ECF subfamily)